MDPNQYVSVVDALCVVLGCKTRIQAHAGKEGERERQRHGGRGRGEEV
jgi:hypothetical protein